MTQAPAFIDAYLEVSAVESHTAWALALTRPGREPLVRSGSVAGDAGAGVAAALAVAIAAAEGLQIRMSSPHHEVINSPLARGLLVFPEVCAAAHPMRHEVARAVGNARLDYLKQAPRLVVAADGSWSRGRRSGGWGFVAADGRHGCGSLTEVGSPVAAELAAIRSVLSRIPAPRRLRILTDSRPAMALIDSPARAPRALRSTVFTIHNALEGREVHLEWVKGHCGPGLHDGADRLAVAARRSRDAGLGSFPRREVVERIIDEAVHAHFGARPRTDLPGLNRLHCGPGGRRAGIGGRRSDFDHAA
jgi:ribonuclease HI